MAKLNSFAAAAGAISIALIMGFGSHPVQSTDSAPFVAPTVTAKGEQLRSVGVAPLPNGRSFPDGPQAEVVNRNCLACHSAGMILTQPNLSRAVWLAEVEKMRKTYKAPIAEEDVPAIVEYLVQLRHGD